MGSKPLADSEGHKSLGEDWDLPRVSSCVLNCILEVFSSAFILSITSHQVWRLGGMNGKAPRTGTLPAEKGIHGNF